MPTLNGARVNNNFMDKPINYSR